MAVIFKIAPRPLWQEAVEKGIFSGAPVDLADGFIHFSAAHQVRETARRHFAGQSGLIIAAFDSDTLGDALRWEASRGGDLFPHLYAPLPVTAALSVADLPLGADGTHQFPKAAPFSEIAA